MRLRQLHIERFRGIRQLRWTLDARLVCLVGPGDSTKTTILDAIGSVLSPRYNLSFADADFYDCDITKPIVITAAIVDLPDKLIEERAHGKNRSGIREDGSLEHDPLDDSDVDECLLVRLTVDQTLEPVWEVIRPDDEIGDRITAGERAQLGFFRVGESADVHLRWGRTSALTGVTASKTEATHAVVEAQRQARRGGRPRRHAASQSGRDCAEQGGRPWECTLLRSASRTRPPHCSWLERIGAARGKSPADELRAWLTPVDQPGGAGCGSSRPIDRGNRRGRAGSGASSPSASSPIPSKPDRERRVPGASNDSRRSGRRSDLCLRIVRRPDSPGNTTVSSRAGGPSVCRGGRPSRSDARAPIVAAGATSGGRGGRHGNRVRSATAC